MKYHKIIGNDTLIKICYQIKTQIYFLYRLKLNLNFTFTRQKLYPLTEELKFTTQMKYLKHCMSKR